MLTDRHRKKCKKSSTYFLATRDTGSVEVGVIVKENGERCQHVDEVRARHRIQPPVESMGDEQGGPGRFNNVDLEERDLLHGLEQGVGLVAKEGK